jgi:hypothetical protein
LAIIPFIYYNRLKTHEKNFKSYLARFLQYIKSKRRQGGNAMTPKEAVSILMLSPVYFKLALRLRLVLVREFCTNFPSERTTAPRF